MRTVLLTIFAAVSLSSAASIDSHYLDTLNDAIRSLRNTSNNRRYMSEEPIQDQIFEASKIERV